jgi:hypothetical protein
MARWAGEDGFGLLGGEGPAGPAGPKAEWVGKVSRAESEEEGFLNLLRFGNLHKEI